MELIRMAKITANLNRGLNNDEYNQIREQFLTDYGAKINELRVGPEIQGIFSNFSNPSYQEKGFNNNYLGQGSSDKYLESIMSKRQSDILSGHLEELQRRQDTTTGAVTSLLEPMTATNIAIDALLDPTQRIDRSVRDLQHDLLGAIGSTSSEVINLQN